MNSTFSSTIQPHSLPSTSTSSSPTFSLFPTNYPFNNTTKWRTPSLHFTVSSSSTPPTKHIWKRKPSNPTIPNSPTSTSPSPRPRRHPQSQVYLDHSVDMDDLLLSISQTSTPEELHSLMSIYKDRQLSHRFIVSLLCRETDWQRTLALLDWMIEVASYSPSVYAYNVTIRNVLRAKQWELASGLVDEMRQKAISPDKFTYSTLITHFGKEGMFDNALSWLQHMEHDRISAISVWSGMKQYSLLSLLHIEH